MLLFTVALDSHRGAKFKMDRNVWTNSSEILYELSLRPGIGLEGNGDYGNFCLARQLDADTVEMIPGEIQSPGALRKYYDGNAAAQAFDPFIKN